MPKVPGTGHAFYKMVVSFRDYSSRCEGRSMKRDPEKRMAYAGEVVMDLKKYGNLSEEDVLEFEKSKFRRSAGFVEYVDALRKAYSLPPRNPEDFEDLHSYDVF